MLLTRTEFREQVFQRDNYKCVNCGRQAMDAHHIIERELWTGENEFGGYFLDNGASLCHDCHLAAEQNLLLPDDIRILSGITHIVLPSHFDPTKIYNKWGETENTFDPSLVKYPSTPHLPWSGELMSAKYANRELSDEAVMLYPDSCFGGKEVVASEKMDAENTTITQDGVHARSINSGRHPSRDLIKSRWANELRFIIPDGWRICGENMYAKHSIHYTHLKDYFLVFSVWNERNICLSWDDTVQFCRDNNLTTVREVYRGLWNKDIDYLIRGGSNNRLESRPHLRGTGPTLFHTDDEIEGYVVRLAESFPFAAFTRSVAKFVRSNHVETGEHWLKKDIVRNQVAE